MQHQEQQQQLAFATSTSGLVVLDVLCVASAADESTRALASAPPSTLRHDSAAVEVARRPSLYREQSPDDRRPHGLTHTTRYCYARRAEAPGPGWPAL